TLGFAVPGMMMASNTPMQLNAYSRGRFTPSDDEIEADAARHVAYIDERLIDVQIIGPRPFMTLGWMEPHLQPSWAEYVNGIIHRHVIPPPDRFPGAGQLPENSDRPDTSTCTPELDRCVNELGFAATYVSPDPGGRSTTPGMHEPYWYPLYERCQELDVPI